MFGRNMQECYTIVGYNGCAYFRRATQLASQIQESNSTVKFNVKGLPREEYKAYIDSVKSEKNLTEAEALEHKTSPFVIKECCKVNPTDFITQAKLFTGIASTCSVDKTQYIGGYTDMKAHFESKSE